MQRLAQFGLHAVILQWSSADATDFYAGRPGATDILAVLPDILRAANRAGLQVWIGLHHDAAWWSAGARADAELGPFLAARAEDLQRRLPHLVAALAAIPPHAVAGWYITDELDDTTWRTAEREAALMKYIGDVAEHLRRASPGRPIAASAFANGTVDPAVYAAQLHRITAAAGLERLLLQDGIGAGKRSPDQARATAAAVAKALHGGLTRFGMVVELFDMISRPGTDGVTQPAPLGTILDRIGATAGLAELPATSFSHAHHLTPLGGPLAAARGAEWMQMLKTCKLTRHKPGRADRPIMNRTA